MAEFSLIDRYCKELGASHPETKLSIGDDAAIVQVPDDKELVISVDTMVEGVHFFPGVAPADLAQKLMAVNLSDMAAMGAQPKWATMTLTTPDYDHAWLAAFSKAIDDIAKTHEVQLIGGDTTQGPLNVSMQIMGLVPTGKGLKRSGAQPGDHIYVSNSVGDAALALQLIGDNLEPKSPIRASTDKALNEALIRALLRPEPQCKLGQGLLNLASSCIDVSDGLVADLGHIARQSNVSMVLEVADLPLSDAFCHVSKPVDYDLALTGGDDYQLAFTAAPSNQDECEALSLSLDVPITRIGYVVEQSEQAVTLTMNEKTYVLRNNAGFQHFTEGC